MKNRAALYLRSSKDRSDVSIDSQRRELQNLATNRGWLVLQEYTDVVESAKDERRLGFQQLLADLKAPGRGWDILLMVDTSRLSRRRYVAQVFKHEAKKRGIDIVYSKVPETDPITSVILEAVLEAFDEVHSLMSREKGLAGMAENVRKGFRAGGRAPRGYRLKTVATGAIREGEAVAKSVLEPSEDSTIVARYLKARAAKVPRAKIWRDLGMDCPMTSLIGMEWNALTYAGHTVWNQRSTFEQGHYKGGRKFRPREEWVIQKDTHTPLITEAEAETILAQLQNSAIGQAVSRAKAGISEYLLTGILKTPSGQLWTANGKRHYRTKTENGSKGRWVPMDKVDQAVTDQLLTDMRSPEFVKVLTQEAHKAATAFQEDPAKDLRREVVDINGQISKAMDIAMQLADPAPALRKVNELEARRKGLADEVARMEREYSTQAALARITEEQIRGILTGLADNFEAMPREKLKGLVRALVDQIVLDPSTLECRIHYRIPVENRLSMASPREGDGYPVLEYIRHRLIN